MKVRSKSSRRGVYLIVTGLVLAGVTFGASWALAPDTNTVPAQKDVNESTLVGIQGAGWGGSVVEFDSNGSRLWRIGDAISYQGVSRLENGTVLATFADKYRNCGPYKPPCKRTGVRYIDPNPTPKIVGEWSYPVRTRKDSEVHDAEMLPSGELLVADMEYESVFTLAPNGTKTWVWNASEYYDAPPDPTRADWLHINDADRIGPGRYLVSVRNENQLLVIQRGKGVVEVINEDGDPSVLNQQHNPQWLGDGAVVVADSENDRVVELHRNETTGEWGVTWAVYEAGGISFDWPRDADRLPNGHTLVTDSRNNRIVEIQRNGSVVSSLRVNDLPYEADRVPYGESFGQPYDSDSGRDVFGARNVDVPVLSTMLAAARHVVPLPFWVSELHVFAVLVAVGCWVSGGWILVLDQWRSNR